MKCLKMANDQSKSGLYIYNITWDFTEIAYIPEIRAVSTRKLCHYILHHKGVVNNQWQK